MSKRLQLHLTEEAHTIVESVARECNEGFELGSISYSDVVNEMIATSKIDIRAIQAKHTDIRRSLKKFAADPNIDLESAIKSLIELKGKASGKRPARSNSIQDQEAT